MGWRTHCRTSFPCRPTFPDCGTVLPLLPFPEALKGWHSPSLILSFRLPWLAGFGIAGPLVGGALLPSLAGPRENTCFYVLRKRLGVWYIYGQRRENPGAKQTNENEMTTQDLQNAEASAFAAKQSAFRSYCAAVGTEAEQAASEAYHSAFLSYAQALDAWMGARKGGSL